MQPVPTYLGFSECVCYGSELRSIPDAGRVDELQSDNHDRGPGWTRQCDAVGTGRRHSVEDLTFRTERDIGSSQFQTEFAGEDIADAHSCGPGRSCSRQKENMRYCGWQDRKRTLPVSRVPIAFERKENIASPAKNTL